MKTLFIILPYLLSLPIGFLLIELIFRKEKALPISLQLIFSMGLGLSVSSSLTFSSFIFLNQLNKELIVVAHIIIIILLFLARTRLIKGTYAYPTVSGIKPANILIWAIVIAGLVPIWLEAKYYPFGGWDAWSVWNYKAKFLLLAGTHWQNLFDPSLWRSSPHYPLLLPLINVWAWTFFDSAQHIAPLTTSFIFTSLTACLLLASLYYVTKKSFAAFAPLLFLTLPFYGQLTSSQYCDIVVSFYALAALFCLKEMIRKKQLALSVLGGIFLGVLSFTKPEGTILSLIILFVTLIVMFLDRDNMHRPFTKKAALFILSAFLIFAVPTIIFQIKYSPGNQTFINGLVSSENPSSDGRAKMTGAFFLMELKSQKWNGLWLLLLAGMILGCRRAFRKEVLIFPVSILLYLAVVFFYYYLNTYFEIRWWLPVTLSRILFSLIPSVTFWIFDAVFSSKGARS